MDRRDEDAALLAVARAMVAISMRAADELGRVSVVQLRALTVLGELGPASLVQLADGIGVTASTTSRLVDRLVAGGYAERRPSPESRRQIELRLTPEGEATLARYDASRLERLRGVLDRMPEERREAVAGALAEFAAGNGVQPEPEPEPAPEPAPDRPDEAGGDPACWLRRVCPACGRLADEDPPTRCPACGETF